MYVRSQDLGIRQVQACAREEADEVPHQLKTNSRALANELRKKCDGSYAHQQLVDGRASAAAKYPTGLCRAICRGIVKAKMERCRGIRVVGEIPAGSPSTRACTVGRRLDPEEFHD